jgi:hypothetical protein
MDRGDLEMKASCAWGDGPDVIVTLEGTKVILYEDPWNHDPPIGQYKHGLISQGSFDLTSKQARQLASELIKAAEGAEYLQNEIEEYEKRSNK